MSRVGISLLGGFRVEMNGRSVPGAAWRHRRGADLVKLLALASGHRLHREQVMEALWPDLSPGAAAANLRKASHFARRALGSEKSISIDGEMIALWPGREVVTDVDRFESAARAALKAADANRCEKAAGLYSGELLPQERYATWAEEPRVRLRLRQLQLLKIAGKWPEVLEIDRTDEEAHRAIMRGHLDAGDRRAAMRQFEHLRDALRDELGVAPDAESVALYERVLAMEGHEPPTPAERARALLAWGLVHWNRQDIDEAERTAEEARALAIDAGLGRELGESSALLGLIAHARGRWREMFRDEFVESVRRSPQLAPFVFDAQLCFTEFSLYGQEGHEQIAPFARELLGVAEEAGSVHGQALAMLMLGEVELLSGRLSKAEQALNRAASLHESAGADSGLSLSLERLAEAALARARRWRARQLLARSMRIAKSHPLAPHLVARAYGTMVQAAADAPGAMEIVEEAEAALEGKEVCQPCSIGFRVAAAITAARAGDQARAQRHIDDADRIAGMWQGGPWVAAVWEARGVLRQAQGDEAQAKALFREAADAFARVGRQLDAQRCLEAARVGRDSRRRT